MERPTDIQTALSFPSPHWRFHEERGGRLPIVILGGGLAGVFCALKLAPLPVLLMTNTFLGEGASLWAQGGLAAVVSEGDTIEAHVADTIRAGAGLVDPEQACLMARASRASVYDLLHYGVLFDRNAEGAFILSREAAHSVRRVVCVQGDRAGRGIMEALIAHIHKTPSVKLYEGMAVHEVRVQNGRVKGILFSDKNNVLFSLAAESVVLATGGSGHLYARTTTPPQANGEGLALAARAGAVISDAEFVQFHPTALDIGLDPAPLATEALRGEGGFLITSDGRSLMRTLHPDGDLAPRNLVSRAVFCAQQKGESVFLDCRHLFSRAVFAQRFPTVFQSCQKAGIDPTQMPIPVCPAAHYHMGGVATDARGRTSLPGLWACGEVACTGTHGANRLASNSLLESVVFADAVAQDIRASVSPEPPEEALFIETKALHPDIPDSVMQNSMRLLRETMTTYVGGERSQSGLHTALQIFSKLETQVKTQCPSLTGARAHALYNRILAASIITFSALERTESRGCHFRADYPETSPVLQKRLFLRWADF